MGRGSQGELELLLLSSLSSVSISPRSLSYYICSPGSLALLNYWHFKQLTRESEARWLTVTLQCVISHAGARRQTVC